jgi:hypothetical protein
MGRPIKKSFFGNLNTPPIGGEGISSTILIASTGTGYSLGSTLVFSAPQLPDGVTATGTPTIGNTTLQGRISAVTLVNGGSGYTSSATISVTTASSISRAGAGTETETTIYLSTTGIFVGMEVSGTGVGTGALVEAVGAGSVTVTVANASTVTGTLVFNDIGSGFAAVTALTAAVTNAIAVTAYVPGGSSGVVGDIVKQEASRRYLVKTAQGVGQCKLVTTSTLAAGEMTIGATDVNGSTYYVKKLTANRAVLVQDTVSGSFEYVDNSAAGWTLGAATTGTVSIASN